MACEKCKKRDLLDEKVLKFFKGFCVTLVLGLLFFLSVTMCVFVWNNAVPRGAFGFVLFLFSMITTAYFGHLFWEAAGDV